MEQYDPERIIGLIVDEWGTWYDVEPGTNRGFCRLGARADGFRRTMTAVSENAGGRKGCRAELRVSEERIDRRRRPTLRQLSIIRAEHDVLVVVAEAGPVQGQPADMGRVRLDL